MTNDLMAIRVRLMHGRDIECDPAPGRVFLVGPRDTFADLAAAVNLAFARWDIAHLHVFELPDGRMLGRPDDELDFEDDQKIRVRQALGAGSFFTYRFDLGDDWTHDCVIEATGIDVDDEDGPIPTPVVVFGWGTIPDQYGRVDDDREKEGFAFY
jgi:hypothetical protein